METGGNNQQQVTCASVIKGIRLRNYDSFTFQWHRFDATFRYKYPLDISECVGCLLRHLL